MLDAEQAAKNRNTPLPTKSDTLVASEQLRYQAYLEAVSKHPEQAFAETLVLWKSNISTNTQRIAVVHSLGLVQKSEEITALQFMLQALESPAQQRKECIRLARGNHIGQNSASKYLLLLESNPMLKQCIHTNTESGMAR
jgi:hypothetical protein